MSPQCLPPSYYSIQLTIGELMRFEDFQDCHLAGHLRYWNRMILSILNLYVAPMPQVWAQSTLQLGEDVIWRISRWLLYTHLGCPNGTNLAVLNLHVSQCLPLGFSLIRLTILKQMSFQDGHHGSHLGYWNRTNLSILNLHVAPMPLTRFGLNLKLPSGSRHGLKIFKMASWQPSWISEQNDFSNSESLC